MSTSTMTSRAALARLIDLAVLRPDQGEDAVRSACALAERLGIGNVTVKPCHVALAASLTGPGTIVGTVLGFPHGSSRTEVKAFEAELALQDGARELDMVCNTGLLKSGHLAEYERDVAAVVAVARKNGAAVKAIIETGLLTGQEIVLASLACERGGAAFVKTSTGFGPRGASVEDIVLMRSVLQASTAVKASGAIKSLEQALALVEAGATRLGCSDPEPILADLPG